MHNPPSLLSAYGDIAYKLKKFQKKPLTILSVCDIIGERFEIGLLRV